MPENEIIKEIYEKVEIYERKIHEFTGMLDERERYIKQLEDSAQRQ